MFQALKPLYDRLYEIISAEFVTRRALITTFERGFAARDPRTTDNSLYPWALLEWANIGEVHTVANPNNFVRYPYTASYQVDVPLLIMTFADAAEQDRLIFNNEPAANNNQNLGIGDLVHQISDHLFDHYRSGFFTDPPSPDWIVPMWTIGGVQTPRSAHINSLLVLNNHIRATQINIRIIVAEVTD